MRCLGLTDERRRCDKNALDGSGYCAEHQHFAPANTSTAPRGIAKFWHRNGPAVPDSARFGIPAHLNKQSTPALAQILLRDPNAFTRWSVAFALRKRRDPTALEPLWDALQRDRVALVRQQCAVAIGKIGTGAALGPLVQALWHDADSGVRQACAVALGNLRYACAATDLANVLAREQSAFVRWDCVLALGQVGTAAVEPLLNELAQSERAQVIRDASREAIEAIHKRAAAT